jgi:methylated-DNA-protein-cysteine methyltransferase related protein
MPDMFKAILNQIRKVPFGKVATYGDIAYAAGFPGAARQVAWALHSAARGLPWHRIVGAQGVILCTGELGFEQRMRLHAEGVAFKGSRVDIESHRHEFFNAGRAERKAAAGSRKQQKKRAR